MLDSIIANSIIAGTIVCHDGDVDGAFDGATIINGFGPVVSMGMEVNECNFDSSLHGNVVYVVKSEALQYSRDLLFLACAFSIKSSMYLSSSDRFLIWKGPPDGFSFPSM